MQGISGQIAESLKKTMVIPESGNPVDFIKANLKQVQQTPMSEPLADPAAQIAQGQPVVEVPEPKKEEEVLPVKEEPKLFEMPKVEAKVEPKQDHKVAEPVTDTDQVVEEEGKESWKGLRNKVTRAVNRQKELEEALEKERQEKEKILKGEIEIEPIKVLKEKTQELEKYRDLYALETNPEFIKTYVEPLNTTKEALKKYSEEYGVPIGELEKLIDVDSVSQVNKFLGSRFDPVGAAEVKNLVNQAKLLKTNLETAKSSPRSSLESMLSSAEEARKHQEMERVGKIDTSARTSWVKAATKLQTQEKFPELQFRGDPDHDTIVRQVFDNAAKEFGIFVQYMADAGVKDLPEPIAEILAERFVRSELANSIAESRNIIFKEYQEVLNSAAVRKKYERPPLGSTFRGGAPIGEVDKKGPSSPLEAADAILARIGAKG